MTRLLPAPVAEDLSAGVGEAIPPREVPVERPPEARAQTAPPARPPWYIAHGMLGEAEVHGVFTYSREDADKTAGDLVHAVAAYLGEVALTTVRQRMTDLLASGDVTEWNELLNTGDVFDAGGHVVWLRPVLSGVRPLELAAVQEPPQAILPEGVRKYTVRWSSTVAHSFSSRSTSHTVETFLYTLLDVGSSVATAMVLGLPQIGVEAGRVERTDDRHNLITGRKLFVGDTIAFGSEVRMRVFIDGHERTPSVINGTDGASREPRRLVVNFPAEFTGGGEPHLDHLGLAPAPVVADSEAGSALAAPPAQARLRRGGEVLNAADTSELVAALQRYLLTDAGLGVGAVVAFTAEALRHLSERTVRLRGPMLLTSGDHTGAVRITGPRGRGLTGHLRIRLRPKRAQLVAVTDAVKVRDDLGGGHAHSLTEGGSSSATAAFVISGVGLAPPSTRLGDHHPRAAGLAPLAVLSGTLGRRWQYSTTAQALSHTIFNSTETRARYHALLEAEVQFVPDDGRALPVLTAPVPSDLAVPWLGGEGAAEFERRLAGRVVSSYLADQGKGKGKAREGTPAQPLPFQPTSVAGPVDAATAYDPVPPGPLRLPGYEAPGMLRRGGEMGFGSASALPGAELVADFFRDRLVEAYGRGRSGADWTRVERALTMHFGRPALEGSAQDLAAGIVEDVPVGGRIFRLAVRGHLLGTDPKRRESSASVDIRAAATTVTMGSRGRHWKVSLSVGGAARLSILDWLKVRLGALRAGISVEGGTQTGFTSGTTAYRRKGNETTSLASVHDIAYELSLRSVDRGPRVEEQVWLHLPGDMVAELLTPEADTGLRPVVVAAEPGTGRPRYSRMWPAGDAGLDFRRGSTGLYPVFAFTPHLQFFAANLYHDLLGKPWSRHFATWPKEIIDTFKPSELAARFGHLTSAAGYAVRLPGSDGWSTTLTVRMRALRPELIATPGDGVEIEHYMRALTRRSQTTSRKVSLGADLSLGLQAEAGSQSPSGQVPQSHAFGAVGEHDAAVLAVSHGGAAAPEGGVATGTAQHVPVVASASSGGRVVASGHGGLGAHWSQGVEKGTGSIEISRGTYSGKFSTYRTDPVFSLTFKAVKGKSVKTFTRYVRIDRGLDLEVPERRIEDLFPPERTEPGPTEPRSPQPSEAATSSAPGTGRLDYAEGRLPRTLGWPEVLDADGVAPAIVRRLRARGVLAPDGRPGTKEQRDLEHVILSRFHRDELQSDLPDLLDQGMHTWLPVSGMFGSTQYLSVRVLVESVDPAHAQRSRHDIRLTLRGESIEERHRSRARGTGWRAGVGLAARGGTHPHEGGEDGRHLTAARHGGADLSAGFLAESVRSGKSSDRKVGIYRASTTGEDTGYEFEHRVVFRIELLMTRELPQIVEAVITDLPQTMASLFRVARRFMGNTGGQEHPVHHPPARLPALLWREEGSAEAELVSGSLRYLVPRHFTAPRNISLPGPYQSPFARTYGTAPRWEATEPRPPVDAVVDLFHPWDIPAAGAVQRWAKVAAAGRTARPDLTLDDVWEVPGLDVTTTEGLTYESATREAQLRPFLADLLKNTYRLEFGQGSLTVGLRVTAARRLLDIVEPRMKQRRYEQVAEEEESGTEQVSGRHLFAGPEGRGPASDGVGVLLGRGAVGYELIQETGHGGSAFETEETNREATRTWRHYVFDVTVLLTPDGPSSSLSVDVPEGLYGMVPVDADGEVPHVVREWLDSLGASGSVTHVLEPERSPGRPAPSQTQVGTQAPAAEGEASIAPAFVDDKPLRPNPDYAVDEYRRAYQDHPATQGVPVAGRTVEVPLQAPPAARRDEDAPGARDDAALSAIVDEAVAAVARQTGPGRAALARPSPLDCVTLLEKLLGLLYPPLEYPVRTGRGAARALVAATTDPVGVEQRLAWGPGWEAVPSWESLARVVTEAGPGATGLVVVCRPRRTGHAFALHHIAGGLRWIALQAPAGQRVSRHPYLENPLRTTPENEGAPVPYESRDACAVVVGRDGQVLAHALSGWWPGTAHAADAVHTRLTGAIVSPSPSAPASEPWAPHARAVRAASTLVRGSQAAATPSLSWRRVPVRDALRDPLTPNRTTQSTEALEPAPQPSGTTQGLQPPQGRVIQLPFSVVRHVQGFDLARLTRLNPERLAALSSQGSKREVLAQKTVRSAVLLASSAILRHIETQTSRRVSLTNADLFLNIPSEDLDLWFAIAQGVANRLRHRVRVALPDDGALLELCPQR